MSALDKTHMICYNACTMANFNEPQYERKQQRPAPEQRRREALARLAEIIMRSETAMIRPDESRYSLKSPIRPLPHAHLLYRGHELKRVYCEPKQEGADNDS